MPTPFYHLNVAEDLLRQPGLSPATCNFLQSNYSAFLLGNTAPDVQTVSGQDRQATHFFNLPIQPWAQPAWERLLSLYPFLAQPARLPTPQAAFLAGYLCHLQADWLWVVEIYSPVFGPTVAWQTFSHRLYLHNVLRAYLDLQILAHLPANIGMGLERAYPQRWLPFVEDRYLCQWRDSLGRQLRPGSAVQTVEVFAARQGISPDTFYSLLGSEERLEREIFTHLPRQTLQAYRQRLFAENVRLLDGYLSNLVGAS